jgi:hypothetical protein
LGLDWHFVDQVWQNYYYLHGSKIVDAAVFFEKNGYIDGTYMCLSFQFKKTLSLGRGGAILCDDEKDYEALKRMSHDGRTDVHPWKEQNIKSMGYHYYMTPETATLGSQKLKNAVAKPSQGSGDYPYLPGMAIFKNRD